MLKRVLAAGMLGGVILMAWAFVANAYFGLSGRLLMNQVRDEPLVYSVLREAVVAPGVYIVNPSLDASGAFPWGQPVYQIRYSGVGHEAAGRDQNVNFLLAFVLSVLVAGLLSVASGSVLSRYVYRLLFVVCIGLMFALVCDFSQWGIAGYPPGTALALGASRLGSWVAVGLATAWVVRPATSGS